MISNRPVSGFSHDQLIAKLARARGQLHLLMEALPADGWRGPRADHLNPPLWEVGHLIWFQERWCLRTRSDGSLAPSLLADADALYDSSAVPHDTRWDLPLLDCAALTDYAELVTAAITTRLQRAFTPELAYFAELCLYHELMHLEAWWMAFQNLGYAAPAQSRTANDLPAHAKRVVLPAAEEALGSEPDEGFIFDNEKWRHRVKVAAFDVDVRPVSETEFAAFVDAGGYETPRYWEPEGWTWRRDSEAEHPLYWRRKPAGWQARHFNSWAPLDPQAPVLHINRYEAEACATWMERALPSAAQWLHASRQTDFRWGTCWEWLRDAFQPYPGFSADPYADYSQPWFGSHAELRGGGPFTDPALKRPGFRNFYLPHRRDPFAGFRTVSAEAPRKAQARNKVNKSLR